MLTVTVDRLVYHAVQGVRVTENDLFLYFHTYYLQLVYSEIKNLLVEVVPSVHQLDRISVGEESVEVSCGIGLLEF